MRDFLRLLRLAAPYKGWMALAVVLGAGTVASGIGLLATSAYLISAAALHPSVAELSAAIVGVRFFGLARGVLRYLERYTSHTISLGLLARWRVWFYEALEPLAPARLMQFRSGDLLTRAVADVDTLQDFYVRVLAPPLVSLILAVGMGLWLWSYSPALALTLLVAWLVTGVGLPALVRSASRDAAAHLVAERAALHAQLVDAIQGLPDLTAFGQTSAVLRRAQESESSYERAQMRLARINALQTALGSGLTNGTMLLVLVIAIVLVEAGEFSGIYLAVLALATAASFEAVLPLPQAAQALESALAAARRLFELVDVEPVVREPALPVPLPILTPTLQAETRAADLASQQPLIELRGVRFAYCKLEQPALDGVSLRVQAGAHIVIVGPSGAGKTTLANLLVRFWDPAEGEILLGAAPLSKLPLADIRRTIGVIAQRTYLFNASVRDNLRVARPDATDAEIEEAARRAQLHAFIESLPRGYDTPIGERGMLLSGGERQRLGIARALLRDTPVLLLDEPTANLDPATERALLRSVLELMRDRTLLLITHRLIGLDALDEIIVLDRGRVVAQGTHAALVAQGGLYQRMWDLQNRAGQLTDLEQIPL